MFSDKVMRPKGRFGPRASAWFGGLVLLVCAPFVWQTLRDLDFDRVAHCFASLAPWQWLVAGIATACSFAALGRYDAIWHRVTRSGVAPQRARRAGMAAIAISQSLGLTALTSGMVRWRCLPELKLTNVATISAAVGLSFLTGWAVCALGAAALLGLLPALPWPVWVSGFVVVVAALPVMARHLPMGVAGAAMPLMGWIMLDLAFAGTALWVLMPAGADLPWATLVAAYVLALGAGLVGNSPGGVGPFELTLLALLPMLPQEEVLASLLAFRVVYYLIPFALGAIYVMRPAPAPASVPPIGPADWGLAQQSGQIKALGRSWGHVLPLATGPCLLGDAIGADEPALHPMPAYKVGAETAILARRQGWPVSRICDEAVLDPRDWSLDGRSKRRLRQAVSRAAARDVVIKRATGPLPLHDLTAIAEDWARAHGGELGLTVGRYCPDAVKKQAVYLIFAAGKLCGFVTFNVARGDWSLDLIRYTGDLPEGAVHSAITTALADAQAAGIARFSLGAVPSLEGALARWAWQKAGLRQFKSLYAPRWIPRYFMAPSRVQYAATALAILWGVHRPLPRLMSRVHHHLASFGVASWSPARDIRATPKDKTSHDTDRQRADAHADLSQMASG